MAVELEKLEALVSYLAQSLVENTPPDNEYLAYLQREPESALYLFDIIADMEDAEMDTNSAFYSGCVFAIELSIARIQAAIETGNKAANKLMELIMAKLVEKISAGRHTVSFWLPVLQAFYEVHVELSEPLKDAYVELISNEEDIDASEVDAEGGNSIESLINELDELSPYEVVSNFFAQSHMLPEEFFFDLVADLLEFEKGTDAAILTLLHPKALQRDLVVDIFAKYLANVELSPRSLTRLQMIKSWYPKSYHDAFDQMIKAQRKRGVVFGAPRPAIINKIVASEIDGAGAQGILIHVDDSGQNRLCGLLLKSDFGIKEAWTTQVLDEQELERFYGESEDDVVLFREVDTDYLQKITDHFVSITCARGDIPPIYLLEIAEILGMSFAPNPIEIDRAIEDSAVAIVPFTPEELRASLARSKNWTKSQVFTETWYVENPVIDKIVNNHCSFVGGTKVCDFKEAINQVFTDEFEPNRDEWRFHFLWVSMWLKPYAKRSEKFWLDSFFIAYAIHTGIPLKEIPIMQEVCYQSVVNSVETMHERGTHLAKS